MTGVSGRRPGRRTDEDVLEHLCEPESPPIGVPLRQAVALHAPPLRRGTPFPDPPQHCGRRANRHGRTADERRPAVERAPMPRVERWLKGVRQCGARHGREYRSEYTGDRRPALNVPGHVQPNSSPNERADPKMHLSTCHAASLVGGNITLLIPERDTHYPMLTHHRDNLAQRRIEVVLEQWWTRRLEIAVWILLDVAGPHELEFVSSRHALDDAGHMGDA